MKKDKLREFYADRAMQEAWTTFIVEVLKEEIIKKAFRGEDVKAIAEARKILEKAFSSLYDVFEPKVKREVDDKAL